MPHELTEQFSRHGLRLARTLEEMLDEHPSHCTERRGCGYTQATRFLSTHVNEPGAPDDTHDLAVFEDWPLRETGFATAALLAAGWPHGWRRLHELDLAGRAAAAQFSGVVDALAALEARIGAIHAALQWPESRLIVRLLRHVLMRDGGASDILPPMPLKPQIGSCSQAEEFFLELAHARVRRGGSVNVFVDDDDRPLLIEKMNLGESHSAIVLEDVCLNGVDLPAGSLCALAHVDNASASATRYGLRLPMRAIAEARFLRLTTLAVEPCDRRRAFSAQLEAEVRGRMLSPETTTLEELRGFAAEQAGVAA